MTPLNDQPHTVRELDRRGAEVSRAIEREIAEVTKRPPATSQVGRVFGCADERGLTALLAPREHGATLTVNDAGSQGAGLKVVTMVFAICAALLGVTGVAVGKAGLVYGAAGIASIALLFLVVTAADGWRRRRRVRRIADAVLARVEALDEPPARSEEPEEVEAPATRRARQRRAD